MALTLNIKANDALEKSALAAAKALDEVAKREKKINALGKKIGVSEKQLGKFARAFGEQEKKNAEQQKKRSEERKKSAKESAEALKHTALAITGAAAGAAALAAGLAMAAKHAGDSKDNARALLNAWTGGRGEQALKIIDNLAGQLGMKFEDARDKFIEFRKAGVRSNQMAFDLIKLRADILAVSKSAATADEEINSIVSRAGNPYALAAKLAEVKRAYKVTGEGAKAAANSTQSVDAAMNKLSNTTSTALATVWEKIGPSIGKAANRLADFVDKLVNSESGSKALESIAAGFTKISDSINDRNLTRALEVMQALIATAGDAARGLKALFGGGIGYSAAQLDASTKSLDKNAEFLAQRAKEMGIDISRGVAEGIAAKAAEASEASHDMADKTAHAFADKLEIHSPSKVFEGYGKNTVEGYRQGQAKELGAASSPLQLTAKSEASKPGASPAAPVASSGPSITIEAINVQGGGDAQAIGRAISQELRLLLQAGALSRGLP